MPVPNSAPMKTVDGTSNKMPVINSIIPVTIRPQDSAPSLVNKATDSGCAVNLKYKVWKRITAAIIRTIQENNVLAFMPYVNIVNDE
jgi:hypothetical protein